MKIKSGILLYFLAVFLLIAIAVSGAQKKVVILQTTDVHCHLRYYKWMERPSGWLRIASIIKKERIQAGGTQNVLLIDCGDSIQGTYLGAVSKGKAAEEMLNGLNYDVWVVGNHEFDFGVNNLFGLCQSVNAICLAANLTWDKMEPQPLQWKLFTKNGVKIAVIGMTSPVVDRWLWGQGMSGFKVTTIGKALDRCMPALLESAPDMIILAVHQGRFPSTHKSENSLEHIAKKFPQIDLILGGHTHQDIPGEKIGSHTWYAEAGKHGENLLRVEAMVDLKKHYVTNINSRLIPVTSSIPEDRELALKLKKWFKKTYKLSKKIVGETLRPIVPPTADNPYSSLNELCCKAIAESSGSDAVMFGVSKKAGELSGTIKEWNVFRIIPYEDTIGTLMLNAEEIQKISDEQWQQYDKGLFQALWSSDSNRRNNDRDKENNPSKKVLDRKAVSRGFCDELGNDSKRIPIAFSSYVLAGAGGKFPYLKKLAKNPRNKPHDTGILIRDALKKYISKHSPITKQ